MPLYKYILDFLKGDKEETIQPYHIRVGTLEDKEDIRLILSEFHKTSPFKDIKVDKDKSTEFIVKAVTDDNCKVLIATLDKAVVGILIGTIQEFPFSLEKNALEVVWYVVPEHRGYLGKELYHAFHTWCLSRDVSVISMAAPTDNYKLRAFYTSLGYTPIEDVYMLYIQKDIPPWLQLH